MSISSRIFEEKNVNGSKRIIRGPGEYDLWGKNLKSRDAVSLSREQVERGTRSAILNRSLPF
jgi:hypothetical protein